MGREFYDLIRYLSDPEWPAPDLSLLDAALRQTEWRGKVPTLATGRLLVRILTGNFGSLTCDRRARGFSAWGSA